MACGRATIPTATTRSTLTGNKNCAPAARTGAKRGPWASFFCQLRRSMRDIASSARLVRRRWPRVSTTIASSVRPNDTSIRCLPRMSPSLMPRRALMCAYLPWAGTAMSPASGRHFFGTAVPADGFVKADGVLHRLFRLQGRQSWVAEFYSGCWACRFRSSSFWPSSCDRRTS